MMMAAFSNMETVHIDAYALLLKTLGMPKEEFEAFRDFGFGTPTGVSYPVEAAGTLRAPAKWSQQSANSMAMGYEVAVTPLQLAAA